MRNEIENAAKVIQDGGVILYPTDTIWGLGCDPMNDKALEKIIQIKQRNDSKNFIILVDGEPLIHQYVVEIPEICYDLIDLAENPLTIIYPKGKRVSKKIIADDGSIAIRITKHEFCAGLIKKMRSGLVSTSANISGKPFPTKFADIPVEIISGVDYVVNLPNQDSVGKPSQIIKVGSKGEINIIRK